MSFPAILPGEEGKRRSTVGVERAVEEELAGDFGGNGVLARKNEQTVEELENDAGIAEGLVGQDGGRIARDGDGVLGREKSGRVEAAQQREGGRLHDGVAAEVQLGDGK